VKHLELLQLEIYIKVVANHFLKQMTLVTLTNLAGQTAATQANCLAAGVPAGGAEQPTTQIRAFVGGNPYLKPEEGENATLA
jgi:hypothetical protein